MIVYFTKGVLPAFTCVLLVIFVLHKAGVSCLVALAVLTTHTFAPGVKFSNVFQLLKRSHWNFLTCFNYSVISVQLSIQLHTSQFSSPGQNWSGLGESASYLFKNGITDQANSILVLNYYPPSAKERHGEDWIVRISSVPETENSIVCNFHLWQKIILVQY